MTVRSSGVLQHASDARLIERARAGDPAAFTAIVARYHRPLLRYCTRYVSRDRAEDVVQEAFTNAFLALGRGDDEINLRPWLYRIAHNAAVSTLRRGSLSQEELREDHASGEALVETVERAERLRATVAHIRDLPDKQRRALLWHVAEGRSYQTIASALMISPSAAQMLVHRARARLRAAAGALMPPALTGRVAALVGGVSERVPGGGRAIAGVSGALLAAGTIAVVGTVHSAPPADASRVAPGSARSVPASALFAGALLPAALEHRTRTVAHGRSRHASRRPVRRRPTGPTRPARINVASTPTPPRAPSAASQPTTPAPSSPTGGSQHAPATTTSPAAPSHEEDAPDKVDPGTGDSTPAPAAGSAPAAGDAPEASTPDSGDTSDGG